MYGRDAGVGTAWGAARLSFMPNLAGDTTSCPLRTPPPLPSGLSNTRYAVTSMSGRVSPPPPGDFQGGGECVAENTCTAALSSSLGSSKYFPQTQYLSYLNDPDQANNPDLWGWNHVFVECASFHVRSALALTPPAHADCSQDLHSGTRNTTSSQTFGLYFSGQFIHDAIVNDLVASHGLASATDIVVTGESAGGIGVCCTSVGCTLY